MAVQGYAAGGSCASGRLRVGGSRAYDLLWNCATAAPICFKKAA